MSGRGGPKLNFLSYLKPKIPYEPYLVELAKRNRKNLTYSERIMWNYLKGKKLMGYDFDRQKPILRYIVDFFCEELMLAIEIDGITHLDDDKDAFNRQKQIEELGVVFLRFNALDVIRDPLTIINSIESWIASRGL